MIDSQMQRGQQWLKSLLQLIGISAEVTGSDPAPIENGDLSEQDSYWLTIDETDLMPEQVQVLIGSQGTVLDAIQYLANASLNLNQTAEQQASYTVELNGYRVRRQAEIRVLAEAAALEVRSSGKEVEIKSLSSAERRQIHTFLKDFTDLETFSRGKEPHRYLVVQQIQQ
jgi:spoIIIJ-associated protein